MGRIVTTIASVVLVAMGVVACTGDDGAGGGSGGSGGSDAGSSEQSLETTASVGTVAGKLAGKRRRAFLRGTVDTVDAWLDAAYVAPEYPRSGAGRAFARFTPGATKLARRQPRVMSNAAVGDRIEQVTVKKRRVVVDALAPGGKPAGATARVHLVIELDGDVTRTDRVRGRLLLTPTKRGWRVFGFDVRRNVMGRGK